MFVFAAIALSGLTVDLIKVLVGRTRPYLWRDGGLYHFAPPGWTSLYQSFPSGHAANLFAAALAASMLLPAWRRPLLALAGLLALTRLAVGAHYPSDLLGGAAVAILVTLALRRWCWARGWVFRRSPGDGYRLRAEKSWARAGDFRDLPQEGKYLDGVRADCHQALEQYETIPAYGETLPVVSYAGLASVQFRYDLHY